MGWKWWLTEVGEQRHRGARAAESFHPLTDQGLHVADACCTTSAAMAILFVYLKYFTEALLILL